MTVAETGHFKGELTLQEVPLCDNMVEFDEIISQHEKPL